jgi:hypothetical protein
MPLTFLRNLGIVSAAGITTTKLGTGAVLQVVSTNKTDTFSTSSTSFVDITSFSVTLTPSSATSKFLIFVRISSNNDGVGHPYFRLMRDSTAIHIGDASASLTRASSVGGFISASWQQSDHVIIHTDSPNTTSSIVYKVQCAMESPNTLYINKSSRDTGSADARTASSINVMEIAG